MQVLQEVREKRPSGCEGRCCLLTLSGQRTRQSQTEVQDRTDAADCMKTNRFISADSAGNQLSSCFSHHVDQIMRRFSTSSTAF